MESKIKKLFYKKMYGPMYSVWYGIKELLSDLISFLKDLKKPKTWTSILVIVSVYAMLTDNAELFFWMVPFVIVIYMLILKVDGEYKNEIFKNALLKDNDIILKEEYKKYEKDCYFKKLVPLNYSDWKAHETEVLKNNKDLVEK